MKLRTYDDPGAFLRDAEPFFGAEESRFNLIWGLARQLVRQGRATAAAPYLGVVYEGDEVVLVALRTPPRNVVLSRGPDAAVDLVAADLAAGWPDLCGVGGEPKPTKRFVDTWLELTGKTAEMSEDLILYEARSITPPVGVPGEWRLARATETDLLERWFARFTQDVFHGRTAAPPRSAAVVGIERGEANFWVVEDRPVSLVVRNRDTPHGCGIGPVYTPPEQRGCGYSQAASAAVCERLFAKGYRFVFLFAEEANPISNRVYLNIGFVPVGRMLMFSFAGGPVDE
jgi:uncharacterized protein